MPLILGASLSCHLLAEFLLPSATFLLPSSTFSDMYRTVDGDGRNHVDLAEFLASVPKAPWMMDLLGISEEQRNGSRKDLEALLT